MKNNAKAFVKLCDLVEGGYCIRLGKFEVSIWQNKNKLEHHHFTGKNLVEAVSNIKEIK